MTLRFRPGDWVRYHLLASDPGLQQVKQGAKTLLATVLTLLIFRHLKPEIALYAGIAAGFLMQCTAGKERGVRQRCLLFTTGGVIVTASLGNGLGSRLIAKELLLVAVAFSVFYVRRFTPGRATFPIYAFTLTLLATIHPGGLRPALLYAAAVAGAGTIAFLVLFFVLPDESLRGFRHSLNLFLYRSRRLEQDPRRLSDLRVLHATIAFEAEDEANFRRLAPEVSGRAMADQYETIQVLTIWSDTAREIDGDAAMAATVELCRAEAKRLRASLTQDVEGLRMASG